MPKRFWTFVVAVFATVCVAHAQFGSFGDIPVEITADGETRFEDGVAVAENNVQIHYGEISIYSDYAEYNPDTRDVLLMGNIRIYSPQAVLTGQRGLYNLESKQLRALEFATEYYPLKVRAFTMRAPSMNEFRFRDAIFTTDDSSEPSFRVKAKTVRLYPDSRVVFLNSAVYIGKIPILWLPYLWANLQETGFEFLPGYDSSWGAYLLTAYSFPIGDGKNMIARVRADVRSELGFAVGFDSEFKFGKDDRSFGLFRSYYAFDTQPDRKVGGPGEPAESGDEGRYRVSFQHRLFLTDDIYATFDINVLSDQDFLEDYFPGEFRTDPQPDNAISLTKWDEYYTLTLLGRFQVNDFQQVTERLPELSWDISQQQFFGLPIYYNGSSSVGYLERAFEDGSGLPDYSSGRFDTFHQFSLPQTYFGWLSLTPRAGFRGTYYSQTGTFFSDDPNLQVTDEEGIVTTERQSIQSTPLNSPTPFLTEGGATFRPIFNTGIDGSFKLSKTYERIQTRLLGLDGVKHVMQPYFNYSVVYNAGDSPEEILQFDRVVPSTQLLPISFPEFTSTDTIDTWNILRLGMRNRLHTRRGDGNHEWFTLDTFFDINFDNPYSDADVSNVFNLIRFRPVNWLYFQVDSQLPVVTEGFTEVNTNITYFPIRDWMISLGHRYIDNNTFFEDSSQLTFYTYMRFNENWGASIYEQYEFTENLLLYQRYMIHRDLSSWVASVGVQVRDNLGGDLEYGVLFVLGLKDAPQVTLPLAFEQSTSPLGPGASGQ